MTHEAGLEARGPARNGELLGAATIDAFSRSLHGLIKHLHLRKPVRSLVRCGALG